MIELQLGEPIPYRDACWACVGGHHYACTGCSCCERPQRQSQEVGATARTR